MITDIEGTILDVNESFTRITGYSREEAVGQSPPVLVIAIAASLALLAMTASAAIQGFMDCHVASLLAVTRGWRPRSDVEESP